MTDTQDVEAPEISVSVRINREKYVTSRTASGTKSLNNNDDVAQLLTGLSVDAVHAIATECLDMDTSEKYGHLNVGMQRMNVGNRLRGFVNPKEMPEGETYESRLAWVQGVAQPHIDAAATKAAEAEVVEVKEEEAA